MIDPIDYKEPACAHDYVIAYCNRQTEFYAEYYTAVVGKKVFAYFYIKTVIAVKGRFYDTCQRSSNVYAPLFSRNFIR